MGKVRVSLEDKEDEDRGGSAGQELPRVPWMRAWGAGEKRAL